jgi:hypothetical protein
MSFVSETEVMVATRSVKWRRAINGNHRVIDVVFVVDLPQKPLCENVASRRLSSPLVDSNFVRNGPLESIDDGVREILPIIKPNHGPIHHDLIRAPIGVRP